MPIAIPIIQYEGPRCASGEEGGCIEERTSAASEPDRDRARVEVARREIRIPVIVEVADLDGSRVLARLLLNLIGERAVAVPEEH